jgi:hypothetical protein
MAKAKAESISLDELRGAVEKAVKKVQGAGRFEDSFVSHPGVIFGRLIANQISLDEADSIAKTITDSVGAATKKAGIPSISPAVLKLPGRIIVGFVEQHARLFVD